MPARVAPGLRGAVARAAPGLREVVAQAARGRGEPVARVAPGRHAAWARVGASGHSMGARRPARCRLARRGLPRKARLGVGSRRAVRRGSHGRPWHRGRTRAHRRLQRAGALGAGRARTGAPRACRGRCRRPYKPHLVGGRGYSLHIARKSRGPPRPNGPRVKWGFWGCPASPVGTDRAGRVPRFADARVAPNARSDASKRTRPTPPHGVSLISRAQPACDAAHTVWRGRHVKRVAQWPSASRKRSASIAALQPEPAAVMAWR